MTKSRFRPQSITQTLAIFAAASISAGAGEIGFDLEKKRKLEVVPVASPLTFAAGKLVFDFEERIRWELREDNFDFTDALDVATDDNWFLQRARLGLKVSPTSWMRVYGQAQDSREIDSDRADLPGLLAAEGDDSFDLRQGWIEIGNSKAFPLSLKAGRQVLSYGDERLIGAFDWNNLGRTFDAVKLRWDAKIWSFDAFVSSVVVPVRGSYNQSDLFNGNETDRQQTFSGLYFSTTSVGPQTTDFYLLHLHENANPRFSRNPFGDTNFVTVGGRIRSKPGAFARSEEKNRGDGKSVASKPAAGPTGLDYEAELAIQSGNVRGLDLTAFAVHGGAGYTYEAAWIPRVGLAYSFGTGDDDPTDQEIETFQNLFPTNHKFYGQLDAFSWQNMHDLEVNFRIQPAKAITAKAEFHAFWLASTDDVWYRANGLTAVRPLTPEAREADSYAGSEVDLIITWSVNSQLQLEGGYSHFFAGQYLDDTGPDDDADFVYLQTKLSF